jgi:O-antigen biosynthesis protein WbqP
MNQQLYIKRLFDIFVSGVLLAVFGLPMLIIAILIRWTSKGPAIHWSKRVGKGSRIFLMPKFRTMSLNTPQLATHVLAAGAVNYVTPLGGFLRKTSLDELPQLWSVFLGAMSLVGPRPALFNQDDLVELRKQAGVDQLQPGITGWAQVNGRDDLPIPIKVNFDKEYLEKYSILFDFRILILTVVKVVRKEGVHH